MEICNASGDPVLLSAAELRGLQQPGTDARIPIDRVGQQQRGSGLAPTPRPGSGVVVVTAHSHFFRDCRYLLVEDGKKSRRDAVDDDDSAGGETLAELARERVIRNAGMVRFVLRRESRGAGLGTEGPEGHVVYSVDPPTLSEPLEGLGFQRPH